MRTTVNPGHEPSDGSDDLTEIVALTVALVRQSADVAGGVARAVGLSETDAASLRALDVLAAGGLSAGALAERLSLSNAATTGVLDRLERAGLARRAPDRHDRRRLVVTLTERARTLGEAYLAPLHQRIEAATAALEPGQSRAVRDFLAAMVAATAPRLADARPGDRHG